MERLGSSFRDPSGFVFFREGVIYRQINQSYAEDYRHLMDVGLYDELAAASMLVRHSEVNEPPSEGSGALTVIRPDPIPFISYPYEWCLAQWIDAAVLTLNIQERAIRKGMTLKDATAFNVQFTGGRPVHIDTLSFERIADTSPLWVAYRQFCEHFLAPICIMAYCGTEGARIFESFLNGVPLEFACKLLPTRCFLNFHRALHLGVHAWANNRFKSKKRQPGRSSVQRRLALVDSLRSALRGLNRGNSRSDWNTYYAKSVSYNPETKRHKEEIVRKMIHEIKPASVWDLGCNTGAFSSIALSEGATCVVAIDADEACIDSFYCQLAASECIEVLPLVIDITCPTPALGWSNLERMSLTERGPADLVLALAISHHLMITSNLPAESIADFLWLCGRRLILEFVAMEDPMSKVLLESKSCTGIYYSMESFETAFEKRFQILEKVELGDSRRVLYHMERR